LYLTHMLRERIFTALLVAVIHLAGFAQITDYRYTEEQVSEEKMMIEAKKYYILQDYDAAIDLFGQILKKYPRNDVAAFELAGILFRQGKYQDALHNVNLAIEIDDSNKWYLILKANIYDQLKQYHQTAEVYEQLSRLDPSNVEVFRKKAFYYAQAGELAKSVEVLDDLQLQIGVNQETSLLKHDLYKKMGKKNKALDEVEILSRSFPGNISYKHILANYYRAIGKNSQAEDTFRDILRLDPNDARANVALASAFRKEGKHASYLSSIRPIIENEEASIDIKIAELMPYVRQVQQNPTSEEASTLLELAEILEKTHPNEAKAFALHADLLSLTGQTELALEKYQRTLELNPSNFLVWEQLLLGMAEMKRFDELAQYSENAIDLFPNQGMLFYMNGYALVELGRHDDAAESLEQALIMAGRNENLKFNIYGIIGKAYRESGRADDASQAYDKALVIKPDDPVVLNDYSFLLAVMSDELDQAESMLQKALKAKPNNPHFLATQSWIQYRRKDFEAARITLEKSLKNGGGKYGYILEKYGDILYSLDQPDKAMKSWKEAKQLGGTTNLLDRKISEGKLIEAQ